MFTAGAPVGSMSPYFLSQADVTLEETKPISSQPDLDKILAQALQTAGVLKGFIDAATHDVDIAIYDFRLEPGELTSTIVDAINAAAGRGVQVRIAYDKKAAGAADATIKDFAPADGDPAPTGTHRFLAAAGFHATVQLQPITEAIDPGSQIMHNKYIVRDRTQAHPAVLMGSANFTTDAWGIQDNNILVIEDGGSLAGAYGQDFDDLWAAAALAGTGKGDTGSTQVGGLEVKYGFAPGEGSTIEKLLADTIASAKTRLLVATMLVTSQLVLDALVAQKGLAEFAGVYDKSEMGPLANRWSQAAVGSPGTAKLAAWNQLAAVWVEKPSFPFAADHPHNLMHNKVVVADDQVVSGSFNFSDNATRNAENLVVITNQGLADQYADYIQQLVKQYEPG